MVGQPRKAAVSAVVSILLTDSYIHPSHSLLLSPLSTFDYHHTNRARIESFAKSRPPFLVSTTRLLHSNSNSNESQQEAIGTQDSPHHAADSSTTPAKLSKRAKVLKFLGMHGSSSKRHDKKFIANDLEDGTKSKEGPFEIYTVKELDDYFNDVQGRFRKHNGAQEDSADNVDDDIDYDSLLASLSVKGDTQILGSPDNKDAVHPVVQLLHERRREIEKIKSVKGGTSESPGTPESRGKNITGERNYVERTLPPHDGYRVALAIEGGGMRGCVTAGMVAAIHHLGLEDTIDVVYGSSAGTVIGAYFITRQLPWFGPEVYYDALTTAGDRFINTKRFLRAVGLGMLDPRLTKDVIFRRNHGKPVLDLSYLLKTTMQENKPLDWETFEKMQKMQPLKVMASGLKSQKAVIMDMERGSFRNLKELAHCMHASCLLPGVAGPVMNLRKDTSTLLEPAMFARNKVQGEDYEPMADALLFEPLPFRPAISEGATHVICLRSRPDGVDVTGKSSLFERLIVRRFFIRKNRLQEAYRYMKKHLHKKRYAEDVIILNEAAHDLKRKYSDTSKPHLLPIAVPPGSQEVTRLETGRQAIFEGVRRGFARAYDVLVEDVEQRGKGVMVAKEVFPDDILDYNPVECTSTSMSAYETYKQGLKHRESLSTSP
ncbi:hypothetical protein HJC23_003830 [Cyclotella cryptica]|uniref:PNPLA domain-containing protein n=1 Tax=Cyclotella cryptica TaxID=29204 RepID=A0ABD3Q4Y4_9STRA|eukprot:CCRYP_009986-RA/>CCRYP_009986-RA protein AED:0.06 eAED:0.06 QI:0/-1/0/1/-1/1/1/0/657